MNGWQKTGGIKKIMKTSESMQEFQGLHKNLWLWPLSHSGFALLRHILKSRKRKANTCIYLHQLIFIKSAYKFLASFQIYNKNEIYFYFYSSFSSKRLVAFLLYVRKIACLSSIHTQTTSFLSKKKWEALHIYFLYTFFYTKACLSRNNNSDTHYYTVCTIFLYQIMIMITQRVVVVGVFKGGIFMRYFLLYCHARCSTKAFF